jgi:WD40 repeat protein
LDLFIAVCDAVEHAHQKGVIHRDLKPTNVLVGRRSDQDGRPLVKIIDFGVAKAINQRLTEQTLITGFTQMLGTPLYMSPEQAELSPIGVDTRSDIYSLGVLLYELLTGSTPFDKERLHSAPYVELLRIIREEDPPRPSTRISTLAADLATTVAERRRTDVRRLRQTVRGDLDWIVMKCLDKDRNRRYDSAKCLAADIGRYLADRPVDARPPSIADRIHKFTRRHKLGFAMAGAALALGVSVFMIFQQRNEAQTQRRSAQQLADQSRKRDYAADMKLAFRSWTAGDVGDAIDLLERHWPADGQPDLRSFGWHYLWGQVGLVQSGVPLGWRRGHTGEIYFVTYSPDGRRLATASQDGTVRVWDAARGETLLSLRGHQGEVTGVSFSPDGRMLASAGDDRTVRIWDATDGKEHAVLRGHTATVFNAVFSPDGTLLASAGSDGVVKLWDPATGAERGTLPGHADDIEHLAFSPDGRILATAGGELSHLEPPKIKLWDVATGSETATLLGHREDVLYVAFSPDGRTLASASADRTVKLWDVASARELHTLREHRSDVHAVVFSPDGSTVASVSRDGTVRLWDAASGRLARGSIVQAERIWSVAYSPDGRRLATAGRDRTVKFWDLDLSAVPVRQRLPIETQQLAATALSFDGKWLATIAEGENGWDGRVWDATDGAEVLRFFFGSRLETEALAFSPSSATLAFYADGQLVLLEVPSGRRRLSTPLREPVRFVAISPGDRLLATGVLDPGAPVSIWHADTGDLLAALETYGAPVVKTVFSPDGRTLAGLPHGADDGATDVWLWNTETGQLRGSLDADGHGENWAAFAPNGRILATVGGITARLWDVQTHALRATLSGHDLSVTRCAFSPDGRTLATAADDGTVRLWHVATGQELFALEGHTGPIRFLAFFPDGRRLLTAGTGADGRGEFYVWTAAQEADAIDASNSPRRVAN